jgi:hypothetical protein
MKNHKPAPPRVITKELYITDRCEKSELNCSSVVRGQYRRRVSGGDFEELATARGARLRDQAREGPAAHLGVAGRDGGWLLVVDNYSVEAYPAVPKYIPHGRGGLRGSLNAWHARLCALASIEPLEDAWGERLGLSAN